MIEATEIRVGHILKLDGKLGKVLSQEIRGTGKFGKTVHLKVKSMEDGRTHEKSFRAEDKAEDIEVRRVKMEYSYQDGDQFVFMNMENFEQFFLSAKSVGAERAFLKENSEIDILFEGDKALAIDFPKVAELKVTNTAPPVKGSRDSTYKEAELENGLKLLVPQFIKEGDVIRVDIEELSYRDRVTTKTLGGDHPEKEKESL